MSYIKFYKFHGTGNDFIIIDNRDKIIHWNSPAYIKSLCNRRLGIGADGLILLEESSLGAFYMRYFNSDGNESTMCGNGGRCIVAFAEKLGIIQKDELINFHAIDGMHQAIWHEGDVSLKMVDVKAVEQNSWGYFIDTGSPHIVCFVDDPGVVDVVKAGREIRNHPSFGSKGTNVNFVKKTGEGMLDVRTYERGVEDETLSCGTGCVASVLADHYLNGNCDRYRVRVKGGILWVKFEPLQRGIYRDIWLEGPARFVFEGNIRLF